MTENTKLLSCPFCGGSAQIIIDNIVNMTGHIECFCCGIEVSYSDCPKSAVEIWNKRCE